MFFAALCLPQDSRGELFCSNDGGDPLHALLEGALGQQAACQLKGAGVKYGNNGAGRTSWHLFPLPIIENSSTDGSLFDSLAKNKFCTDMLGLLGPKTTLNLC